MRECICRQTQEEVAENEEFNSDSLGVNSEFKVNGSDIGLFLGQRANDPAMRNDRSSHSFVLSYCMFFMTKKDVQCRGHSLTKDSSSLFLQELHLQCNLQ